MGRVDSGLTRDVQARMVVRAVAHVDLLDIADRTPWRSRHARRAEQQSPGPGQRSFTV